jgi:hypothetical protein
VLIERHEPCVRLLRGGEQTLVIFSVWWVTVRSVLR